MNKLSGAFYMCNSSRCRKKISLLLGFNEKLPQIPLKSILMAAYCFSMKCLNYQSTIFSGISETIYIKLKIFFIRSLKRSNMGVNERLGGPGLVLQIDETACNRRRIITSPTSEEEFVRDTVWVVGVICETNLNIRMAVLPDQTVNSFKRFLIENVNKNSIIKTDGFKSYPEAVSAANCTHLIVNHSEGFVAPDGTHTNLIENL